jgi:hypothetical protein
MKSMKFQGELQQSDNKAIISLEGELFCNSNKIRNSYKGQILNPAYSSETQDILAIFLPGNHKINLVICTLQSIEEIVQYEKTKQKNDVNKFLQFTPTYKLENFYKKRISDDNPYAGTYNGSCVHLKYLI